MNRARTIILIVFFIFIILAGNASAQIPFEAKFRVGPTVSLRPVTDVIEAYQDGIVELYMDNPALNDVMLTVEARITVPSGIHVYGQGFAMAGATGVAMGQFEVPPGTARTISINIKADETARIGSHNIKFTGLYYPGDNKDNYQPISLTYGVNVKEVSEAFVTPVPVFTKPRPVFTPAPENAVAPVIIGLFVILILFIVWLYVVIWVARDANKRGKSGTLWGIVAFFLGLIGLLIYLIARPKGRLVLCEYCRKEKLETLTQCPHCKQPTPAFEPAQPLVHAQYPAAPKKTHEPVARPQANELEELKEKLHKTNQLLDKLDERLVNGELTEAKYKELAGKYKSEADSIKNLISEKELLSEVGLKDE